MGQTTNENPRVGVVLVTHGGCGEAMLAAANDVLGTDLPALEVVGHPQTEPRSDLSMRVIDAANRVDGGGGVVFLVDLCGSTPGNVCQEAVKAMSGRGEIVFGLNLPMLIKVATLDRSRTPVELANGVVETGKRSVRTLRDMTHPTGPIVVEAAKGQGR